MLLVLPVQRAGRVEHIVDVAAGKDAVVMILVIFLHVEVDGTFALVSIAVVQDLLHQFDLFDDMSGCMRFDAGRQDVERFHRMMVTVQVILHHFHRLQLFEAGFLGNLVFAVIRVVFEVADIGYVAYVTYFVSYMSQVTEQEVEGDGRACMPQMRIAVNGRTTNIHTHMRLVQRDELFLFSCKRVVNT